MFVDSANRHIDGEADEEELLLLLQPHQFHLHHPVVVVEIHHKVLAAVVEGQPALRHRDENGRADAPEGFLELVQQSQRYDAAVLRGVRNNRQTLKQLSHNETDVCDHSVVTPCDCTAPVLFLFL